MSELKVHKELKMEVQQTDKWLCKFETKMNKEMNPFFQTQKIQKHKKFLIKEQRNYEREKKLT
jgi:hypothetical protein